MQVSQITQDRFSTPVHLIFSLKEHFEPFQSYHEAVNTLIRISAAFDGNKDPLSKILLDWCDDFVFPFYGNHPETMEDFIALSAEHLNKLKKLFSEYLGSHGEITEKPFLGSDGWLWDKKILDHYTETLSQLNRPGVSPFTGKPFTAESHPFAEAMIAWLKAMPEEEFIPLEESARATQKVGVEVLGAIVPAAPHCQDIEVMDLNPQAKLILYQTMASKIRWKKQAKATQEQLIRTNENIRRVTRETEALIQQESARARLNEERRNAEVSEKLANIEQACQGAVTVLNEQLKDVEQQLQREKETAKQTEAVIEKLGEKIVLNGKEQEKLQALHEEALDERIQQIEKAHRSTSESLQGQIGDIKQDRERIERRVQILKLCTAQQEETIKQQEIRIMQAEQKLHAQEAHIANLANQKERPWWKIF